MSGLDGILRADVTWVGSGEKEEESFHVCFSAAQCWLGTVAEQGSAWLASLHLSKSSVCLFVCWFVCQLFIGHTTFVHFAAMPPSGRESRSRRRARPRAPRGPARRAGASMPNESTLACRTTSQRENRCADAFQKTISRTRARMLSYT